MQNKLSVQSDNMVRRWWLATCVVVAMSLSIFCYGLVNAAQSASNSTGIETQKTILVVGDSLSAEYGIARGSGWVSLLQARLSSDGLPYKTVNASISGETTAGGRTRIKRLLDKHQPAVVILELGANDALRGLDLNSTRRNLSEMTSASIAAGARVLILGMQVPPNYGPAYTRQFSELFVQVSNEHKAALVPFWFEKIATRMELFQADGIHPNKQAQSILLDTAWPILEPLL